MRFTIIAIEDSIPKTMGLASNSTRKLLSKIPLQVIFINVANTASTVEAFRLVRIPSLEISGLSFEVGEGAVSETVIWVISEAVISSGIESIIYLYR
jgi:hypothetical protein